MNQKTEFPSIIKKLQNFEKLTTDEKRTLEYEIKTDWISKNKINIDRKSIRNSLIKGYENMLKSAA